MANSIFDSGALEQYDKAQDKAAPLILCLDFDGVLHSFDSGWQGADVISDKPVPGAMTFLVKAVKHFSVHIYSSRSNLPGGIEAMRKWLVTALWAEYQHVMTQYDAELVISQLVFDTVKPPAHVTLDDRAILFTGHWPSMQALLYFKPWNR